jgi:two-component system OmpR family sensor kinase
MIMFKSLYIRIAVYTIIVMIFSALVSFLITNVYYHVYLKENNDAKIMRTLKEAKAFETNDGPKYSTDYFKHLGDMNYQILTVNKHGHKQFYGEPFRKDNISQHAISQVLHNKDYHGIKNQPYKLFVTGFFENVTSNTVGVKFTTHNQEFAVFMRPDIGKTFSEFRVFLAVLITLLLIISITLVILSTYAIIKPVKQLKRSTELMMRGNFSTPIKVTRKDELGTLQYRFDAMRQSLKELDSMRQHFVQNVSHEIKTPLTHIHQLLDKLTFTTKKEEQAYYVDEIYRITTQLSELTKELLLLSELDNGSHLSFNDEVKLNNLLTDIVRHERFATEQKGLTIMSDLADITYVGNERLLHQAFQNLITNGIKYSDEYGIIDLSLKENTDAITFTIKNEGNAIDKQTQQHIFERFYKVSNHDNSNGLGLAIAKTIIELHNGHIAVDSEDDATIFTITLPHTK